MTPLPDDPRPPPPSRYRVITVLEAPLVNLMGISCRDFARLQADALDRQLGLPERLRLKLHSRLCSLCRQFASQFNLINELTRDLEAESPPPATPDAEMKRRVERIQASVRERLK